MNLPLRDPRATADTAAAGSGAPRTSRMARLWERRERQLPLLVLGVGAGATFLANVVARRMFTAGQFVDWAYLTSLVTLFFSFSLLGSEQLVMRLARATDDAFELPRRAIGYIVGSFVAFSLAYVVALDGRIFAYRLGLAAIPVLASVSAIQLTHQCERARGNLLVAQVALNTWKVVLLPIVVLAAIGLDERRAEVSVAAALVIGSAAAVWLLLRMRRVFRARPGGGDAGRVFLPFLLSLGVLSALNIADRVTLEKVHESAEFARYVYLTTILVTPFGVLSGYFGFKEAVRYRKACSAAVLRRDVVRTMLLATGCAGGWLVLCYATRGISGVTFDARLWLLMGVLSVLKCGYGVLSAAMGVRGTAGAMYFANLATMTALAVYVAVAVASGASVVSIAAGYVLVWAVRCGAYFLLLGPSVIDDEGRVEEVPLS